MEIFKKIREDQHLAKLTTEIKVHSLPAQSVICNQDQEGCNFFILVKGEALVYVKSQV